MEPVVLSLSEVFNDSGPATEDSQKSGSRHGRPWQRAPAALRDMCKVTVATLETEISWTLNLGKLPIKPSAFDSSWRLERQPQPASLPQGLSQREAAGNLLAIGF